MEREKDGEIHICEKCGVSDANVNYRIRQSKDESRYFAYEGVEYYDVYDSRRPETLEAGWYCNCCVEGAMDAWWREEQKAYIFDEFGNTPDDEEFFWS